MDVLHSMLVFKRVAEINSFTKVAVELDISQSSVSKHVSALESRLGVKLLNRTTRHLKLSDAGQEYYERCRSILTDIEETESLISAGQSKIAGQLRISVPDTFGRHRILPLIWSFLDRYPDVEIDIMMDDRRVDLVQEGIDVAIRSGGVFDPTLITRRLCDIPRVLVASPVYLALHGVPRSLTDLRRHQCIIYSGSPSGQTWGFVVPEGIKNIQVRGRIKVNSPEASILAAQNGFGISLSPNWLSEPMIAEGTLTPLLEQCPPVPFEVHAVFPERSFIPARVRSFVEYLHRQLA